VLTRRRHRHRFVAAVLSLTMVGLSLAQSVHPATTTASTSCLFIVSGRFDAPGDDNVMPGLDGEYVTVKNRCGWSIGLTGWRIRDYGAAHVYRFPTGYRIRAWAAVTIHSGMGRNVANHLYRGRSRGQVWNNVPPEWAFLVNRFGRVVSTWSWPPSPVYSHGSRARPMIALTIDDGGDPAVCRRLLEILDSRHVPATWFPIADNVALDPALWREIADQGFPIGNHTKDHPWMTRRTIRAQYDEIVMARRAVEAITGVPMIRVFRPPYGSYDTSTRRAARAAGFSRVLTWDTTFADTSPTASLAGQIALAKRGTNGSVVLMHCRPRTPLILEPVLDAYIARGFTFVTIPQLLGFSGPTPTFAPIPTPILTPIDRPEPAT